MRKFKVSHHKDSKVNNNTRLKSVKAKFEIQRESSLKTYLKSIHPTGDLVALKARSWKDTSFLTEQDREEIKKVIHN